MYTKPVSFLAQEVAELMVGGFREYIHDFNAITKRAKQRFEQQDWHGIQTDVNERLDLYKGKVKKLAEELIEVLQKSAHDIDLWKEVKYACVYLVPESDLYEIAETFYNSVCRKVFASQGISVNKSFMFVLSAHQHREIYSKEPIYRTYQGNHLVPDLIRNILTDYNFSVPYEDLERDIQWVNERVEQEILTHYKPNQQTRIEVLKSIFYRNKGAYIVGRIYISGNMLPFVLPILHGETGIYIDSFLLEPNDVSIIFSFTRSYFMVEVGVPSEFIRFLKTLIPYKGINELYNSIGYNKHGKTELYRSFLTHLDNSTDQFIIAPGIKGMVMGVFTLPSYNIVFKLIKDKFDPPKTMTRDQVKKKYKLVSRHDRVGRMADTHEFEHFTFPMHRFSPQLLEELQKVAPSIISIDEEKDTITIHHLYTERKMIPLNMYLDKANEEEAEEAVGEYGNAIKQLAAANIFPGDMLLKNFGVTKHRRVVFYDYDEICFLTECNFRRIPEPRDDYEAYSSEAWYSVGPNDIFPEEFRKFLIGHNNIRRMFYRLHGDIFDVKFWKDMQKRQFDQEVIDVFPYRRRKRFQHRS